MLKLAFINFDTTNSKLPVLKQEVRRLQSAGYLVFGFHEVSEFYNPNIPMPQELNYLEQNDLQAGFITLQVDSYEARQQPVTKKIDDFDKQNQLLARELNIELFPVFISEPGLNSLSRGRILEVVIAIARARATPEWQESAGLIIDKNKNEKWHINKFDIASSYKSELHIYTNKFKLSLKLNYASNTYSSLSDSLRHVDSTFSQRHPIMVKLASVVFFSLFAIGLAAPVAYVTLPLLIAMATTAAAAFAGLMIGALAGYLFTRQTPSVPALAIPNAMVENTVKTPVNSRFSQADVYRQMLMAHSVNETVEDATVHSEESEFDPAEIEISSACLPELYESDTSASSSSYASTYLSELGQYETPPSSIRKLSNR
jgi:hypothetical protein